jgi:hypothetical protein
MATVSAKFRPDVQLPARTVVVGLGPIGLSVARALLTHDLVDLVGAVDPAPGRAGRDLGTLLGQKASGLVVRSELQDVLRKERPQLCLLCTSSRMDEVMDDLLLLADHNVCVVTTAEEMANPVLHDAKGAQHLDERSREAGIVMVAAGVNPGFAMDRLVLALCQVTRDIQRVDVTRVVDANHRRPQLLQKMGAGMSPTTFAQLAMQGGVGHVGLRDSMHLVARGLGWELSDYRESIVPVVAKTPMKTPVGALERGQIRGATQRARGLVGKTERISFYLEIAAGAENPRDEFRIEGTPPIHVLVPGSFSGDEATVSGALAAVPFALFARPGLRLPTEMPPDPRALAGLTPLLPKHVVKGGARKAAPQRAAAKPAGKATAKTVAKPSKAKKAIPKSKR